MRKEIAQVANSDQSSAQAARNRTASTINDRIRTSQAQAATESHRMHIDALCEGRQPNWMFDDDGALTPDLERTGCLDAGRTTIADHSANMARIYSVGREEAINFLFNLQAHAEKLDGKPDKINDALGMIAELKPRDAFEAMLISQMVAIHSSAMTMIGRLNNTQYEAPFVRYSNSSTKLMRIFNEQMKTLTRHRTAGKQTVEVKHVYVGDGGQAIVGTVHTGGSAKK